EADNRDAVAIDEGLLHEEVQRAIGVEDRRWRRTTGTGAAEAARTKAVYRERNIAPGYEQLAPALVERAPAAIAAMKQYDRRRSTAVAGLSQVTLQRLRTRQ